MMDKVLLKRLDRCDCLCTAACAPAQGIAQTAAYKPNVAPQGHPFNGGTTKKRDVLDAKCLWVG
jgi:hypothetical protein